MSQQNIKRRRAKSADTSVSPPPKKQKDSDLNTELASLLECVVCTDYILPPIYQCENGHILCVRCKIRLDFCPLCRSFLGDIRNVMMEEVAKKIMFPCAYCNSGCTELLTYSEKAEHENVCQFRLCNCPVPGICKWQGLVREMLPHFATNHKNINNLQGEKIIFMVNNINLPTPANWIVMQSCFNHHFMVIVEKQETEIEGCQQFFAHVLLIGSREQAKNFTCRLEINEHKSFLTWQAIPRSIHEGAATIFNSNCFIFKNTTAQLYAVNGNLGIKVTISMKK